ncbi:hypothetical protein CDO52_26915 [Nocardiopsis gilva YIM 90087]|uniref:Uncharacterized protein n=1 Tax=Nocardiopsis gilva YIM 90087 TaxID=1235441 RepID=A0A223RZW1_9ACTN|nr:hypothetical protein [Nocardiopsis gilva]ASU81394.1 hypothetical protein CDO52_00115 [Nocardiopsis gilva YIM 90087]ASU85941.1 hypothetical protein CDO52_26915 [Nocardiopsis gilva YIM 90087]
MTDVFTLSPMLIAVYVGVGMVDMYLLHRKILAADLERDGICGDCRAIGRRHQEQAMALEMAPPSVQAATILVSSVRWPRRIFARFFVHSCLRQ